MGTNKTNRIIISINKMRDISIFKKIKLFRVFKKRLKEISTELGLKFNIRLDRAYRMYTVINIPEELIGESYSIKKYRCR